MTSLVGALNPTRTDIDWYCRGMVFGLNGSKMLVKFSSIIMKAAKNAKRKFKPGSKKRGGGAFNLMDQMKDGMRAVLETVTDGLKEGEDEKTEEL